MPIIDAILRVRAVGTVAAFIVAASGAHVLFEAPLAVECAVAVSAMTCKLRRAFAREAGPDISAATTFCNTLAAVPLTPPICRDAINTELACASEEPVDPFYAIVMAFPIAAIRVDAFAVVHSHFIFGREFAFVYRAHSRLLVEHDEPVGVREEPVQCALYGNDVLDSVTVKRYTCAIKSVREIFQLTVPVDAFL